MAQQIAVSLARTNFDIHGKLVAISKQMDVGAPGARRRAGRSSARRARPARRRVHTECKEN